MLAKCRRDLEAFTRTQYQAVEAEQSYRRGESTLLGSQAQIAPDVMAEAMNILYGYQTVINPVQMNEWQRTQVGNLLKDISDKKPVSHAAVYNAYQVRHDPRALIEILLAHVSRG
ncbi:hypothetical protein FQJ88_12300 [Xanthomonas vasicola]|uniref:Uncharacterized protein n=1 Tax=Xanthomonas vasicola TaxID=56459 RepID=A0ABD7S644_XANVA|nr:hypothetical protein NX81_000475 [Xanthomonas vasicola]TWQ30087.1 hypothetical protein FQJ97_00490 [Xanthomonas vasicola]TWQ38819.1 hypothetical protein FQJ96_11745 [Xanthomonas vasicola]TWQ50011.1 hypothetical protein FQK01_19970 [Xanthomonas vasicola]TWQ50973.1 hypothetical protein FQJ94_19615 [Xanthomonas vasicola]